MKTANIVSAERDGMTTIICPNCDNRQTFDTISMDEGYVVECSNCKIELIVNVKKWISKINWL